MSGSMIVTIKNAPASYDGHFSGMVYPKGLAKNSSCLSEYRYVKKKINLMFLLAEILIDF